MNLPAVKEDINTEIQRVLIERGIKHEKIIDLIEKAENVAETTKDFLAIADKYGSLMGLNEKKEVKTTVTQEIDYSKMLKGEQPIRKIKQEITSNNIDIIDNYEVNGVIEENNALETKEEEG